MVSKESKLRKRSAWGQMWLLAPLLWLTFAAAAQAQYTTSPDGNGGLVITGYTGPGGAVDIPGKIGGLQVTAIGFSTYGGPFASNATVTSVTIPYGVTSIGDAAFYSCSNLTSVTIPSSVSSIADYAFFDCTALTSATIPNGVTTIGNSSFQSCSALTSLTIPDSVVSIGDSEFYGCTGLTSVTIGNGLTSIGGQAFYMCSGLSSVTIGNSVTSIGKNAFYYCDNLTSVTIPNSVTTIDTEAFYYCIRLSSVTIPPSVTSIGEAAFNSDSTVMNVVFLGNAPTMGLQVFSVDPGFSCTVSYYLGATNFTSPNWTDSSGDAYPTVVLGTNPADFTTTPDGSGGLTITAYTGPGGAAVVPGTLNGLPVTGIGAGAFQGIALTGVQIASSVTSIGASAFQGTSLSSVTIPSSVTSIGQSAFGSCTNLTSITMTANSSYSSVGGVLFNSNQTTLIQYPSGKTGGYTIPGSVTSVGSQAFSLCTGLTSVTIPTNVTSIGAGAFSQCTSLTSVTIPATVTSIGSQTFSQCTGLASVTIPTSVISIGSQAFSQCTGLMSIAIPTSVTSIGAGAFTQCSSLTSITIPTSITSIGSQTFSQCTGLISITIPSTVISIGSQAFSQCTSLASVTIPASVTSIGAGAFSGCTTLTSALFLGNAPTMGSGVFATAGSGFTVAYFLGATGFISPTWTDSSGDSYPALAPPLATLGGATAESTTSVQVTGTYNAQGTSPRMYFDFGTDPTMTDFSSIPASPTTATGYAYTPIAAVLTNLTQATTYYYRLRGTSGPSTVVSAVGSFQTQLLSALLRQFPGAPAVALGSLSVTLLPSASGNYTPGWRLVGEQLWHASGDVVAGLTTGDYEVEYRSTSGYIPPATESVSVTSGTSMVNATVLTRYYYPTPTPANLTLQIYLYPQNVAMSGGWRLYDPTNTTSWHASGYVLPNLSQGTYLVECEAVPGEITPPISSVVVAPTLSGSTVVSTATVGQISYSPTVTAAGVAPQPLSFATITDRSTQGQTMPYAFVGQIRSDVGLSSGFVVAPYVVATAAHVVFDDGTLTANGQGTLGYVSNLQWLFEREAGTYDPVPQTPRGALVLSSYSADRIADGTPGVSSLTSQNEDVAALYFSSYAGGTGGGYSGYQASDSTPNEFLTSTNNKILVGYPVDTEPANEQGEMFATPPVTSAFTQLSDAGGNPLEVYSTNALYSFGGNSGGPLCVQAASGNYYPAGVYLGESAQSVVRAIDSNVINLFTLAETNGETNQNQTGGGTTLVNTTITGGAFGIVSIQVSLPGAPMGAGWSLGPIGSNYPAFAGGFNLTNQSTGTYVLYYASVPYFLTPANFEINPTLSGSYQYSATYEGISGQPANVTAAAGASATFTVTTTGTPSAYQWQYVNGTNAPVNQTGPGATTNSYTVSNLSPASAGKYQVVVTWGTDGPITSAPATLTVTVPQIYTFAQWTALYPSLTSTAQTATPQKDGVTNLMKYLFDIDPTRPMTASDVAALPVLGTTTIASTPYLTLNFREYKDLGPGVTVTVETTTNLASDTWTTPAQATIVPTGATLTGDPPPGLAATTDPIMQARVPLTAPGRQFIRLEVSSP